PIESVTEWKQVEFWRCNPAGFDFRPAGTLASNVDYSCNFDPSNLLSSPQVAGFFSLSTALPGPPIVLRAQFASNRDGILHGIGGWFSAKLSRSVTMTNSPLAPGRIKRSNVFFPLENPVNVM